MSKSRQSRGELQEVAGNGLLHRRIFLTRGATLLGAGGFALLSPGPAAAQNFILAYPPPAR